MEIGTVVGVIDTLRKAPCLGAQPLVLVEAGGQRIVAADQTGAATGDRVVLLTGPAAGSYAMDAPVDAAVVAVLP